MEKNPAALDTGGAQRVIIATLRAWIGSRRIPYGKCRFSGHGFKLAPTISEALTQTVLGLPVRVPIDMYRLQRFEEDAALCGTYGIGSIS